MIPLNPHQLRMLRLAYDDVKVAIVTAKIEGVPPEKLLGERMGMLHLTCIGLGMAKCDKYSRAGATEWARLYLEHYNAKEGDIPSPPVLRALPNVSGAQREQPTRSADRKVPRNKRRARMVG